MCSGFKSQEPPWEGLDRGASPEGGRTRWAEEQGDELTLVAAGLEQAARTNGFLRLLNLTGALIHGLIDCIAVNVFR